jgi:hypothetical protein
LQTLIFRGSRDFSAWGFPRFSRGFWEIGCVNDGILHGKCVQNRGGIVVKNARKRVGENFPRFQSLFLV